ncbi:MAG: DUF2191 domain-containing protein [Candidatus Competibacteraceae bacterium]|nr:DUF2191 domain-containing protein [Candidatus Competibacteraceae bacterium]
MRTTVDLPDDLLRRAKAQAALEGIRLRDLLERGLRLALSQPPGSDQPRRVDFPLLHSSQPGVLSAEALRRAEEQMHLDEDASYGGSG